MSLGITCMLNFTNSDGGFKFYGRQFSKASNAMVFRKGLGDITQRSKQHPNPKDTTRCRRDRQLLRTARKIRGLYGQARRIIYLGSVGNRLYLMILIQNVPDENVDMINKTPCLLNRLLCIRLRV